MKKGRTASKAKEQSTATRYRAGKQAKQPAAKLLRAEPASTKTRRKIRDLPGETVQEEPAELPRLFVQGPVGGSFRMDLRGLDIPFSDAAFAYWVRDESMQKLHIHRGDIAIIDPMREMQPGDLLLLQLDGRDVLRRLAKKHGVWFMETADGTASAAKPLLDHVLHGIVLGVLRLFTQAKSVPYRGTEANFGPLVERGEGQRKVTYGSGKDGRLPKSKTKRRPFLLAAELKSPYRLSEIQEKSSYRV